MSAHITIVPSTGTWVVRARGAVIAETRNALELRENGYSPVYYFPRDDVAMAFLDRTEHQTNCPHKGTASHFTVSVPEAQFKNGAWSYETPKDTVAAIRDHIAFYAGDDMTVEQL